MANWDVYIGLKGEYATRLQIDENATPQQVAKILVELNLIDESEFCGDLYLSLDKKTNAVWLCDDSGFPYATLKRVYESTLGNSANPATEQTNNVPKCPTCGSIDLTKLSIASRAIDGAIFGRLSVEGRAQFRCNKCGYMW